MRRVPEPRRASPSGFSWLRGVLWRARSYLRGQREERELEEEIRFHIDMQTERNSRSGLSASEARRQAVLAFGGRARWKEAARDEFRSRLLDDLSQDVRYGVHTLLRQRGFTVTAAVVIALGIAASVSAFSFVDAVFRRPLPVPRADRLVRVYLADARGGESPFGLGALGILRRGVTSFDEVAAHYSSAPLYVSSSAGSREVQGAVVSASYFRLLGIRPLIGRFFSEAEDAVPDRDAVAVIGYGLWHSRFDRDPLIVGRSIDINGRSFQIIGVAPEGFAGVATDESINELWIPTMMFHVGYRFCDALRESPPCTVTRMLGRLAPASSLARARSEVRALKAALIAASDPADSTLAVVVSRAVGVSPGNQAQHADLARLLSIIAGTLLVISCANLSALLLVRGLARQREIALRASLGASRPRIVRQLMTESALLGLAGGAAGLLLSLWASRALAGFFALDNEGYTHFYGLSVNSRIVLFATGLSMATVILFGLLPAIQSSRVDVASRLKIGARDLAGQRARRLLVGAQVALSFALLVGAGLLTRSFARIASGQRFNPSHVALLRLRPRLVGYSPDSARTFLRTVLRTLHELPQVQSVALGGAGGVLWRSSSTIDIALPGDAPHHDKNAPTVFYAAIAPSFFSTLQIPLLAGRDFTDQDGPGAPRVAIVSESLARRLWPNRSPLGEALILAGQEFHVVGVAADHRPHSIQDAAPAMVFVAFWQNALEQGVDARLAIRVKGDPSAAYPLLQRAVAAVDSRVPITEVLPMTSQVESSYTQLRLGATVLRAAASIALVLSGLGLYGVVAFLVAQRTREIGIRLAIGAAPDAIVTMVLAQGLGPMVCGCVAGLVLSLGVGVLLSGWLYDIRPLDGVAFGLALGCIAAVALLASWVPARRAASVDPVATLRAE